MNTKEKIINALEGQKSEKFILMILIMEDLRGDWSCNCESRAKKVKELADDLSYPKTSELAKRYLEGIKECGDDDGRFFRCDFESEGGYENVKIPTPKEFSKELIKDIELFCNNPEIRLGED